MHINWCSSSSLLLLEYHIAFTNRPLQLAVLCIRLLVNHLMRTAWGPANYMSPQCTLKSKQKTDTHGPSLKHSLNIKTCSYLFKADDSLSRVPVCGYGEHVGPLWVNNAVLDVCIDAEVLIVGFDLPYRFPYLGWFRDVQLVIFCGWTLMCTHLQTAKTCFKQKPVGLKLLSECSTKRA